METCGRCGREYQAGAPHSMFCPGNIKDLTECYPCGEAPAPDENGNVGLAECRGCGVIFCARCGEIDDRRCYDCEDA